MTGAVQTDSPLSVNGQTETSHRTCVRNKSEDPSRAKLVKDDRDDDVEAWVVVAR